MQKWSSNLALKQARLCIDVESRRRSAPQGIGLAGTKGTTR
jgi:hypothetical protein